MSNVVNDQYYLYEEGGNLSAFLYNIHENHKVVYNRIIQTIQSIAPYFSDFSFNPIKKISSVCNGEVNLVQPFMVHQIYLMGQFGLLPLQFCLCNQNFRQALLLTNPNWGYILCNIKISRDD